MTEFRNVINVVAHIHHTLRHRVYSVCYRNVIRLTAGGLGKGDQIIALAGGK